MASVIVDRSHKNMGDWKSRKIAKQNKGSSTTGKSKGIIATPLQRYMCRRSRARNHPMYNEVMAKIGIRGKKAG